MGRPLFSATFRYALISLLEIAGSEEGANSSRVASRHRHEGIHLATVQPKAGAMAEDGMNRSSLLICCSTPSPL